MARNPAFKQITGRRVDLNSVRVSTEITSVMVKGSGVRSLAGIERFNGLRSLSLEGSPASDLRPLIGIRNHLISLNVHQSPTNIDTVSLLEMIALESVVITGIERAQAPTFANLAWETLPKLRELRLVCFEDFGADVRLDWLAGHPHITRIYLHNFGIRQQDTDPVFRARKLSELSFLGRNEDQTRRIIGAFEPRVAQAHSQPPKRRIRYGEVSRDDEGYFVMLDFPESTSNMDQQTQADRLFKGEWRDLRNLIECEQSGDVVWVTAASREPLDDVVERALQRGVCTRESAPGQPAV